MKKEKLIELLKYYIVEDILYLYYENNMYPSWVKRDELVDKIATDISKTSPDKEELKELFRDFFIFHNDANERVINQIDEYFDKWYEHKFPEKPKVCPKCSTDKGTKNCSCT